jgi:predicted RND superfamily exporter protein
LNNNKTAAFFKFAIQSHRQRLAQLIEWILLLQNYLSSLNSFFERAPDYLLKRRLFVVSLFFVISAAFIYAMVTKFTMDMSLESWFKDDDPTKVSLDKYRQQFGSDDGIYIVYEAQDGNVFSSKSVATIRAFHQQLDDHRLGLSSEDVSPEFDRGILQRIDQIDSLYNARYQVADKDTLISKKLYAQDYPTSDLELEQRKSIALGQDAFKLAYFSPDHRFGGIRIKTDFGVISSSEPQVDEGVDLLQGDEFEFDDAAVEIVSTELSDEPIDFEEMSMDEYLVFMTSLRTVAAKPEFAHFSFHFTGNAAMMEFAMNNMAQASMLMGLMLLAVVTLLWILFRSFSAVVWPVVVISFSAFWSIGFLSAIGVTLSTMVSLSFMLILAVGTADCVHVLSAYMLYRQEGEEHRPAMRMAYRKTGIPIFLTTITTMAGMMALMISDLPQIAIFGLNSALGVGVAFIFTLFLLPVLLDLWHPYHLKASKKAEAKKSKYASGGGAGRASSLQHFLDKIPAYIKRKSKVVTLCYIALFGLFVIGTLQVKIDSNLVELAKEDAPIRVTYDLVDKEMMGAQNLEFIVDMKSSDALKEPAVLKVIDAFQAHLVETYPDSVVKTFSLADFVKDTNKVMHEGDPTYDRVPEDPVLAAQLLYLFDNANSRDRRNVVSDDYSKTHISAQLRNKGSFEYTHFFEQVQLDLDRYFEPLKAQYPDLEVSVTGQLALMMELIDHISWAQIKSFAFALVIITILLIFSLGSVQAGLISMIPNLLPAFFTFGLMGLLDIPLDTDTLIIAPLIIGIAVDDTIHFVAHYRDAWFELGDVDAALKSTISEVGQAVTFTTLVLGIGFSMLAFSDYMGLAKTGIFGSLSIVVALSSDLLLLPALISWLKPDLGRKKHMAALVRQEEVGA